MTSEYFKLEVNFFDHAKVVDLGDGAFRLHLTAIAYANRLMTDGFIATNIARRLIDHDPMGQGWDWSDNVKQLLEARLWHEVDGGFLIHDFLEHNTSRDDRLQKRQSERDRKARYREGQRSGDVPTGQDAMSQRDTSGTGRDRSARGASGSQSGPSGASRGAAKVRRSPDPSPAPFGQFPQVSPVDVSHWDTTSPSDGTPRLRDAPTETEVKAETEAETKSKTEGANAPVPQAGPVSITRQLDDFWRTERGKDERTKRTPARQRAIDVPLKAGYPPDDIRDAIRGVALDPWPDRGKNDDLTIILRLGGRGTRNNLEHFRDLWRAQHDPRTAEQRDAATLAEVERAREARHQRKLADRGEAS